MKIIILAGGSGTRLWPVSRQNNPKQVQPFIDNDTLLQKTFNRLKRTFSIEDIYIATNAACLEEIKNQLPDLADEQYIIEPLKKNTAAAIGLAAVKFYFRNPTEKIVVIGSDHFIKNEKEFLRIIKVATEVVTAKPDHGILIGVKPTYPETGYGYIKMNDYKFTVGNDNIFHVDSFKEKPDLAKAEEYISKWEYLWNPGYFIWQVDTLLQQYKKHLPEIYKQLVAINKSFNTKDEVKIIKESFLKMESVSIEYGIMERADNLLVVPADFGFVDIGNWRNIKDVLQNGSQKTISKGLVIEVDSSSNLIYNFNNNHLISTAGLHDMIIIATPDATLICHQEDAQAVKKIVAKLNEMEFDKYL